MPRDFWTYGFESQELSRSQLVSCNSLESSVIDLGCGDILETSIAPVVGESGAA